MNRPVAISLSPNTTRLDLRRTWRILLRPWQWRNETILSGLAGDLSRQIRGRSVIFTSSGRQALYDVLRAYDIGSGDEVALQAFTCIAVPEAVIWTGAKPVYVDIDPTTYNIDLNDLKAKITNKTRAIIIQHTFGIPAAIEQIVDYAHANNIIVIEDCAHALGATHKDQPVGTFGDVAILSFGRDKTISSVFGGAVVSEQAEIMEKIRQFGRERSYPPVSWIIQQLFHPLAMSIIVPLYFVTSVGKVVLIGLQKLGLLSKAVEQQERSGQKPTHINYRFSPALASLLATQIVQLSPFTKRRQDIAKRYMSAFTNDKNILPTVPLEDRPSWLRFPLSVRDGKALRQLARTQNILLGDWYDAVLVPSDFSAQAFQYVPGSCPKAEESAKCIVNLPTYFSLTDQQIEQVISCVKKFIKD